MALRQLHYELMLNGVFMVFNASGSIIRHANHVYIALNYTLRIAHLTLLMFSLK